MEQKRGGQKTQERMTEGEDRGYSREEGSRTKKHTEERRTVESREEK